MTRRPLALLALLGIAAALGVAAGCGGGDSSDSTTEATTDMEATTTEEATEATTEEEASTGDVAAGMVVFSANCTVCHLGDGTEGGGAGPDLSGKGSDHTEAQLRAVVVDGRGAMPAGLASGTDLDDVVAYVASLE